MASQIMDAIAETERACDVRRQEAKEKAQAILDDAQKRCDAMRAEAAVRARDKEKTILAEAEKEAELLIADGREKNRLAEEKLVSDCESRRQAAVRGTALYLLELAKGGS